MESPKIPSAIIGNFVIRNHVPLFWNLLRECWCCLPAAVPFVAKGNAGAVCLISNNQCRNCTCSIILHPGTANTKHFRSTFSLSIQAPSTNNNKHSRSSLSLRPQALSNPAQLPHHGTGLFSTIKPNICTKMVPTRQEKICSNYFHLLNS